MRGRVLGASALLVAIIVLLEAPGGAVDPLG
jgi:hypothetical protein